MQSEIPATMLAVCIDENNRPGIRTVPVPCPAKGEVLIKMQAAPVNPSDLARIKNLGGEERKSFIAGIEGSGTVVSSGGGIIPQWWSGKRVACSSSRHDSGTWAEYMVTSAMACIPLPKNVTFEQGSMMLVNPLTAIAFSQIITKGRHPAAINTAAASALGRMIEFFCEKKHIPLIQIVRNEDQVTRLQDRGAAYVLNSSLPGFAEQLQLMASQLNANIVLDAIGGSLSKVMLTAMPFGSKQIIYGNLSGEDPLTDHRSLVSDNKKIHGFYLVNWMKEQGMATMLFAILQARRLLKKDILIPVQARYPLVKIQEAIEKYLSGMSAGKVILEFEDLKI